MYYTAIEYFALTDVNTSLSLSLFMSCVHHSSRLFFFFFLISLHSPLFFFFFFNDTATTEIYTLSLHDALPISLALAGEAHQQRVDVRLLAVRAVCLADEDALRVAARALQDGLAHQAVVDNHIRSLQQLQRPQREQIGIAGAGSDQVDLADGEPRGEQLPRERPLRPLPLAPQHERSDGACRDARPEPAAGEGAQGTPHRPAARAHEARPPAETLR